MKTKGSPLINTLSVCGLSEGYWTVCCLQFPHWTMSILIWTNQGLSQETSKCCILISLLYKYIFYPYDLPQLILALFAASFFSKWGDLLCCMPKVRAVYWVQSFAHITNVVPENQSAGSDLKVTGHKTPPALSFTMTGLVLGLRFNYLSLIPIRWYLSILYCLEFRQS